MESAPDNDELSAWKNEATSTDDDATSPDYVETERKEEDVLSLETVTQTMLENFSEVAKRKTKFTKDVLLAILQIAMDIFFSHYFRL